MYTGYYSLPFPCIPWEAAMAAAFSLLSAACALRSPPRSSAGGSIGWGAHHSPDPTARHGRRLLLGAALLATAAPASDAFVEGVCVDGQLKWAADEREGAVGGRRLQRLRRLQTPTPSCGSASRSARRSSRRRRGSGLGRGAERVAQSTCSAPERRARWRTRRSA